MPRVFLVLFAVVFWWVAWLEWSSPVLTDLIGGRPVEILLLGLDESQGTRRADTIILVRLEPLLPGIKVMQIPRDTMVKEGRLSRKINAPMAHADSQARQALLACILPWAPQPQRFLRMDFDAFLKLAQEAGPVSWEGERLGPEESLGLIRHRDESGDWGRLDTQRSYLARVIAIMTRRPWIALKLALRWRRWSSAAQTDFTTWEILSLAVRLRPWSGASQVYYFHLPTAPDKAGHLLVSMPDARDLAPYWMGKGGPSSLSADPSRIPIEVVNGSPEPGLAMRATRSLRRMAGELDVLYFGNAARPSASTQLILRQGSLLLAKKTLVSLNRKIGIEISHLIAPNRRRGVRFTILLGDDAKTSPFWERAGPFENF